MDYIHNDIKDIKQIRRDNLFSLIKGMKMTQEQFAKEIKKRPSQISDVLAKSQTGEYRLGIGNAYARTVESQFDLPKNWMDTDHSDKKRNISLPLANFSPIEILAFNKIRKLSEESKKRLIDLMDVMS